ncbi:MAG: DUF5799 family protein [Haloferacaceae archaeon]
MANWQDLVVGDRMSVDQKFNSRLQEAAFNNQEWGLIMTAAEFEIAHPEDPERARIVANTEKLPSIMPELDNLGNPMGGMGGAGREKSGSGGLFGSVKDALGLGGGSGGVDQQRLEEAEQLTQEYADALQQHLEENGKWETVRERAAAGGSQE